MKADMEVTLTHNGKDWIAYNDQIRVTGESLAQMEDELEKSITTSGNYSKGSELTVFLGFDNETIPTWMRQYASHYFNRFLSIQVK